MGPEQTDRQRPIGSEGGITATLGKTIRDESTVALAAAIAPGAVTTTAEITTTRLSAVIETVTEDSEYQTVWTHIEESGPVVFTDHRRPARDEDAAAFPESGVHYEPTVQTPAQRPSQTLINTSYLATAADEIAGEGPVITVYVDDAGLLALVPDSGPGIVVAPTVTASHPAVSLEDLSEAELNDTLARNEERA